MTAALIESWYMSRTNFKATSLTTVSIALSIGLSQLFPRMAWTELAIFSPILEATTASQMAFSTASLSIWMLMPYLLHVGLDHLDPDSLTSPGLR
jgi:hypothetical protein